MFRNQLILLLSTLILFMFGCAETEPKVTPEQAIAFSIVLENQVRDMKIDFLEKNIMMPAFMKKINAAGKFKSTDRIEQQMKRSLEKNNYEKSIYDVMAGSGSFKKVKQYERDGNQHIIYRVSGSGGFTYIDTELTSFKKQVGIADIFFFNTGQNLSTTVADLMEKLSSHGESAIANQLENRFIAISTHLKNANYEFAKAEFDRLPYDIRNNRLYELRYLEIMSKLGGQEYLDFQQKLETKYSDDAGFQLMMIDVYINQKKYDKALRSINQLDSFINKDPMLDARLELSYSKKEILALYASNAPFGGNVVGLDAAAWRYFGRSPAQLSWGEMATLAVLPNAPSLVHPGKNRQTLMSKRNRLLDQLVAAGKISASDAGLAKMEELPLKPLPLPQEAPHLLQLFKKENKSKSISTKLNSTIDGAMQVNVKDIVDRHHAIFRNNGINNLCALVLDVETGNALAYIGNIYQPANKEMESDVDVVQAPRSPGSALKPILYAGMLADGLLLPNSLVPDIPTQISGYNPQNFDLGYDGAIPAHRALARSLNVPAVRLLQQYKYPRFYELLQQYGITTLKNPADFYGLSLILGGCEVTMWDLAGIYASMARIVNHQEKNKGIVQTADVHPPRYSTEKKLAAPNSNNHFPLDATSIYQTFEAMQEVMRPGEEGLWQQFISSKKIAWKTGTSFGFRDGWALGVTPKNVVAVWVGNTDGEGRAGLVGIETAAPVMFDIFRLLPHVSSPMAPGGWFKNPAYNYSYVPVCRTTGFRANIDCPLADTLKMAPLAGRSPLCPYHSIVQLDASGQYRVNDGCESPANMQQQAWFILPPTMEFYYKQRNHDYKLLPPMKPGCTDASSGKQMEIIYPQAGMKIYVPVDIDGIKGKTIFTATHKNSQAKIFWSLDDQFVGSTERYHQLALSPAPGMHVLTLTDDKGNSISRSFQIIEK